MIFNGSIHKCRRIKQILTALLAPALLLTLTLGSAQATIFVFQVKKINPEPFGSNVGNLVNVNGVLFFATTDRSSGLELWRSDGTPTGTVRVAGINPGSGSSSPSELTPMNGMLFFTADDGRTGRELWTTTNADLDQTTYLPMIGKE